MNRQTLVPTDSMVVTVAACHHHGKYLLTFERLNLACSLVSSLTQMARNIQQVFSFA